ncbi:hypothetical protein F4781DRAFT_90218 [Annulohypoxylon bovei var. microspora]|nr:hypothetical protein F4781DRAFT_90218 [Annulohypoxylon bovei var. microspora]
MARVKKTKEQLRQQHKRTSWTRFHLPRGQDWPAWSTGHEDAHIGPLAGVPGCQKAWLGRKVEDPEQAALIVLWDSAESLTNFQRSPACDAFLQGLPESDAQAPLASGALLRGLSLGDAPAPSRFLSFQWNSGFRFEEDLRGRVSLTALAMPCAGNPVPEAWRSAVYGALAGFLPDGCEDLRVQWPRARAHFWTAWAWADGDRGLQAAAAGDGSARAVLCEFRRWNGYGGATPEREEAAAKSPRARESWARTVGKVMPPVTAWEQERWDVQLAPCFITPEEEEEVDEEKGEEDAEYERNMEEFLKQRLSPR